MKILSAKQWNDISDQLDLLESVKDDNIVLEAYTRKLIKKVEALKKEKRAKTTTAIPNQLIPNYWQKNITEKHKKDLDKWAKEEQLEMERISGCGVKGKIELNIIYRSN
jgi:hypothetical protein